MGFLYIGFAPVRSHNIYFILKKKEKYRQFPTPINMSNCHFSFGCRSGC